MEAKTTKVRSLCWSLVSIEELTVKPKINLKKPDLYEVDAVVEEEEEGIKVLVLDITNADACLSYRLFEIELEWNTWNHTVFSSNFYMMEIFFQCLAFIYKLLMEFTSSWISYFFTVLVHCSALQLVLVIKLLKITFKVKLHISLAKMERNYL